jgi:uncharacterized protein YjbJ (UPF0337 family)
MDWHHIEANWNLVARNVKQKWKKLTNHDLKIINGRRDRLESRICEQYGFAPDHVSQEVDNWMRWQTVTGPQRRRRMQKSPLELASRAASANKRQGQSSGSGADL